MSSYPRSNPSPGCRLFLLVASFCLALCTSLPAAVYREVFNYPNGTVMVPSDTANEQGIGSWRRHDGTGNGVGAWIKVNNGAVSFGGANAQDIFMAIGSSGTINYPFPIAASSPGPIYFAFDVKLSAASATGDYFWAISTTSTSIRAGIRAKASGSGYVLGYGGTNTTYDTTVRDFGTTYRVVLRYNMLAGSANNPGTLYVFSPDLAGVDTAVEANNTAVIAGFIAGTDWDTGIPGPLLNQSAASPVVSSFSNLVIASNFPEAVGAVAFTPLPAAPTFSPAGGTYLVAQNVTITSGTSAATIRYTIDGSNPSPTAGTVYSGPVAIAAATSVKAIAFTDGTTKSPVSTAGYVIGALPVATPTFSPAAGNYATAQSVTIATSTTGSTIRYTTDGSDPTPATGTVYAGPVPVASAMTLKAIAFKSGAPNSAIASATYTIGTPPASAPVFNPAGGFYTLAKSVTLTSATSGASIRYTLDGSTPTSTTGTLYSGAFTVADTTTVKAIAYKAGLTDSLVTSATYNIDNTPVSAPTFSLSEGTYSGVQSVTISTTTGGASIRFTTDGSEPTAAVGTAYSGSILLASNKTLKAIAYKSGVNDSAVTSANYVISAPALAVYGPDGSHWPANTPKPGSADIALIVDVACSWTAIRDAIAAATPAQIEAGLHIRIAPGTLLGNGAGSLSPPVLQNVGQPGLAKNILVSPRDGWGTVDIAPGCRINNVQGVTFARINGTFVLLTNCSYTSWAQSRVSVGFRMTALDGVTVTNCNAYEVVMRDSRVDTQDAMGYAGGDNSAIINSRWEGFYCAPIFRAVGSSAHVDTMQMYGGGYYRGLTISDSVFWGSQNCALQLGGDVPSDPRLGTPFMTLEGSLVASLMMATETRYPVLPGGQAPTLGQAINGAGEDWQLYATDSLVFGSIYTTKWASVAGSRISYNLAPTNNPAQSGGWQYDANMTDWTTADFDAVAPMPTDEYLAIIWAAPAPTPASVSLGGLQQTYSGNPTAITVVTNPAGLPVDVTYDGSPTAPAGVGSYAVVATVNDSDYLGSASGTLVIEPAAAAVMLAGLDHTYDGSGKAAAVTTAPAGVVTTVTYNGDAALPVNAGTYAVIATIADPNYSGPAAGATLTIAPAGAEISLGSLSQIYSGAPLAVTATTNPGGLAVQFTYAGSATPPTNAGSYPVVATINDANYTGTANGTLVVGKAAADILFGNLSQIYDGTPRPVTSATTPAGLGVQLTYNGSATAPTNVGSYAVVATVNDANHAGSATSTLVVAQAPATVTLGDLAQAYDGTPKAITTETTPAGLTVVVTYDGSPTAPTNPGTYAVVATINEANYSGSASGTLCIEVTALVRHLETLNGGIDGSVQVVTAEGISLNGNAWISGDLLVPGAPTIRLNGHPAYGGTIDGSGAAAPANQTITLNGNAALQHVVRRTDALALPVVSAPPAPAGTRNVSLNAVGQSAGDFTTVRDLTLNGSSGPVAVPPGTYGRLTANGSSSFVFGVAGATTPVVYNLQGLILNGTSQVTIVGPVVINLASGTSLNGSMGNAARPEWLQLNLASGGLTLNGNVVFDGFVTAPAGTITINGSSVLNGGVVADRLTVNGSGAVLNVND